MIYQPRNVQPSGVSIDGLLDNTFTMEIQTNSYVSAYQLLIVDFDNNEIYTGSKTTLTNYAYNGDILEIPVNASTIALSNGTNYKWRVRLYQPTADMLITYGLVQATSTTTTIYLQPNINIKAGMAITINSQTKTISSYNSDTGVAVVSSAFSSAPAVGTQYKIYSDFIETVPDYIVYARRTPAVAISNVPSSLTLKYHTFQGTYTQSDNVPIVYHKFDLYTKNDDGTISLVASSDKVYSANLSYTYDSFRTGNKYLIQMTVENDMGVITTTDMYEFNVSYDIVEYLQQPLASFDDKNNAVKVSWVTPVENEATSFRSDAATGIIQDNNNTLTQATFEPGQSIGEGDVVQITNSDCELVIDGKSTQATTTGKNLLENKTKNSGTSRGVTFTLNSDGSYSLNGTNDGTGNATVFLSGSSNPTTLKAGTYYTIPTPNGVQIVGAKIGGGYFQLAASSINQFTLSEDTQAQIYIQVPNGITTTYNNIKVYPMISTTPITQTEYEPYTGEQPSPNPDYPSEIKSVGYENLLQINLTSQTINGVNITVNQDKSVTLSGTVTESFDIVWKSDTFTLPKDTYSIGLITTTNNFNLYLMNSSGNTILMQPATNKFATLTLQNDTTYTALRSWVTSGTSFDNVTFYPMILKGAQQLNSYIPYGKYGIEVKTTGKNKLDNIAVSQTISGITFTVNDDKTITVNGTATAQIVLPISDNIVLSGTYRLSGCPSGGSSSTYELQLYGSGNTVDYGNNNAISTNPNGVVRLVVRNGTTLNNLIFKPQLEEGDTKTEYQPHQQNKSLIVLDQPLRSLPNGVKDIAYIKNNKLYVERYVGSVVLNGSEDWYGFNLHNGTKYFTTNLVKNDIKMVAEPQVRCIANHLQGATITQTWNGSILNSISLATNGYYMQVCMTQEIGTTVEEFKTWLSTHNTQVYYELATPVTEEYGDSAIPYIDGVNYMYVSSNINTTFSLVYPHKTISGNAYDYTEFNPPGVKQTGTIKSYNAITGVGTLMAQYPFTYIPMQSDSYAVVSNIYNVSGFSYLYNTPYNTVNSLYTHGYTATWATPDGLCVLPDDFNITLQFSPDGNFFYDQNGVYQEAVDLITTETDGANNEGAFTIKIDKNKLIFVQNPDISLELPFYTNTTQVFVLSSASVAQINNDYVWDDTATWTDAYTWVEGGTSLERVCNHWWKVQITNTGIKIEEIFPTT